MLMARARKEEEKQQLSIVPRPLKAFCEFPRFPLQLVFLIMYKAWLQSENFLTHAVISVSYWTGPLADHKSQDARLHWRGRRLTMVVWVYCPHSPTTTGSCVSIFSPKLIQLFRKDVECSGGGALGYDSLALLAVLLLFFLPVEVRVLCHLSAPAMRTTPWNCNLKISPSLL